MRLNVNLMSAKDLKDGDFVSIGDPLGVIEQYFGHKGTFEDNGTIRASVAGIVRINPKKRTIGVQHPKAEDVEANKGDHVVGIVTRIRAYSVGIKIYKIKKKFLYEPLFGNIHVSKVARRYVDRLENAFTVGDIIRARVMGMTFNEYDLRTDDRNLGAIHSECNVCGTVLKRNKDRRGSDLICQFCGNQERRKTANDYGHVREKFTY